MAACIFGDLRVHDSDLALIAEILTRVSATLNDANIPMDE